MGASGHRGRGRYSIANSDTESYAITNSFTPSMRTGNSNTYTYGHSHADGDTNTDTNSDSDGHSYTNGNSFGYAYSYTDLNAAGYADAEVASYYAAAASVGLEMLIADSR